MSERPRYEISRALIITIFFYHAAVNAGYNIAGKTRLFGNDKNHGDNFLSSAALTGNNILYGRGAFRTVFLLREFMLNNQIADKMNNGCHKP